MQRSFSTSIGASEYRFGNRDPAPVHIDSAANRPAPTLELESGFPIDNGRAGYPGAAVRRYGWRQARGGGFESAAALTLTAPFACGEDLYATVFVLAGFDVPFAAPAGASA